MPAHERANCRDAVVVFGDEQQGPSKRVVQVFPGEQRSVKGRVGPTECHRTNIEDRIEVVGRGLAEVELVGGHSGRLEEERQKLGQTTHFLHRFADWRAWPEQIS